MAQQSPTSGQPPKWGPHIDAEAKFGNLRNLGEADLFLPVMQNKDTLVFGDVRARLDDHSSNEGNFGLGMRHMLPSGWNLGVYGYWDRRHSPQGNIFRQWTLGGELLGRDWDLRVNDYIPTGTRSYYMSNLNTATLSGTTVTLTGGAENSMAGYDAEIGWRVPVFAVEDPSQLRLYLGGYRFTADNTPTISGPRLRAQFALAQVPGLWRGAQLFVDAEAQHDSPRGSQQFLGFRLRIPLDGAAAPSHLNWQERRMTAPIVRDVDVVTEAGAYGPRETVNTLADGTRFTVISSSSTTGANLPTAVANAGANSTVILSGSFNSTATVTLQSGQTVIGGGSLSVKAPSGRTATLSLSTATVSTTIAGTGSLFTNSAIMMANNSTLDGLAVSLTRSGGVGAIGVYATGVSGATIKNSTITATETGGNTAFGVLVLNLPSGITVSGNTISAVTTAGSVSVGIEVNASVATVTGNTLSATGGGGTNDRSVVLSTATINSGSTGNVNSAGICSAGGGSAGTLYFTNGTTCP